MSDSRKSIIWHVKETRKPCHYGKYSVQIALADSTRWCTALINVITNVIDTLQYIEASMSPSYRPLSRRLDRCDRVIQDESDDSNGGNV